MEDTEQSWDGQEPEIDPSLSESEATQSSDTSFSPNQSFQIERNDLGWANILSKFLVVEFSMIPLAILLIYLFDLPRAGNIASQLVGEDSWISSIVYGMFATIPLLAFFVLSELCGTRWRVFRELRELVLEKLMPILRGIPVWGLLLISLGAGFGEEWLFRGFLQQLVKSWFDIEFGSWLAVLIVALIFGACHALSKTYFIVTFFIGIYFGYLMELTDSVLPAALSHATYDFIALVYLAILDRNVSEQEMDGAIAEMESILKSASESDSA